MCSIATLAIASAGKYLLLSGLATASATIENLFLQLQAVSGI